MRADGAGQVDPRPRRRTSTRAIASLLCSAAVCPPLCVIGPVLGIAALVQIRRNAALGGARLAGLGIALGAALTIAWSAGGLWLHARNFRPLRYGPVTALEKGYAGDIAGFKAEFTGDGATGPDAEAAVFIDTLRRRYGAFLASRQDRRAMAAEPAADRARTRIACVFQFERGFVDAEAVFIRFDEAESRLVLKFASIVIHDARHGDLAYPVTALPAEAGAGEAEESAPPHDGNP